MIPVQPQWLTVNLIPLQKLNKVRLGGLLIPYGWQVVGASPLLLGS